MPGYGWIIIAVFGAVLGYASFITRQYLAERTKKVKVSEQYLTEGEITDRCKEQKDEIIREVEGEMKHLSETIKADLERGQERFGKLDNRLVKLEEKQQENRDTLVEISLNVKQLIKNATATSHA